MKRFSPAPPFLILISLFVALALPSRAQEKPDFEKLSLDKVFEIGGAIWETDIETFYEHFASHGFKWLSNEKVGLRSVHPGLNLFGERVGETIVRSKDNAIHRLDISVFNKGDHGPVQVGAFRDALDRWQTFVTETTKTKPEDSKSAKDSAVGVDRVLWYTDKSAILLESSVSRQGPEFIRLRMAPKPRGAFYLGNSTGMVRQKVTRSDLRRNVKKDAEGNVVIEGIPMVDQGPKGYCAVASAERVFRYYGLDTDQHEMAQLASTSAGGGTSPTLMHEALKKASTGVQLRVFDIIKFEVDDFFDWIEAYNREAKKAGVSMAPDNPYRIRSLDQVYESLDAETYKKVKISRGNYFKGFQKDIEDNIDAGVPLLWGVYIGLYREPKVLPQARGGHMRLIIGYNRRSEEIIYSDSWGAAHAQKRMPIDQAYAMTNGLFTVKPAR